MDSHLKSPLKMKNPINHKKIQPKRKHGNFHRSVFSTSQNVFLLEEDSRWEILGIPQFKLSRTDEEILQEVLAKLSISSNPINIILNNSTT